MGDNHRVSRRWIDYLEPERTTRRVRDTRAWDKFINDRYLPDEPHDDDVTLIKRDRDMADNYYQEYIPKGEDDDDLPEYKYIPTRRTFVPESEYGGHHSSATPMSIKYDTERRQDKSQGNSSYSGREGRTQGSRKRPYEADEPYNAVKIKEEPPDRGYDKYDPTPSTSNYTPRASSSAFTYTPSNHASSHHNESGSIDRNTNVLKTQKSKMPKTGRKEKKLKKTWDWKRESGKKLRKPNTNTNSLEYQRDYEEYKRLGKELKELKKSSKKTKDSYTRLFQKGGNLRTVYAGKDEDSSESSDSSDSSSDTSDSSSSDSHARSNHEDMNNYEYRPSNPGVRIKEEPRDNEEEYNPAQPGFGWTLYR